MVTKLQKEERIKELKDILQKSKLIIISDYRGLNVKEITDLRRRLQNGGADITVAKNTLTKIAAKDLPLKDQIEPYLSGPTALVFSYEDPVGPAKILLDFIKETKKTEIKGGIFEGKNITPDNVKDIASLPSKEVLMSKLMGCIKSPVINLVNVLSGVSRKLVYTIEAIRKQKEENSK